MMTACTQKSQKATVQSEPTTITWIEDKPEHTLQPHKLYPEVPDSLWDALGLQKGVPSSMSCLFCIQKEKLYCSMQDLARRSVSFFLN